MYNQVIQMNDFLFTQETGQCVLISHVNAIGIPVGQRERDQQCQGNGFNFQGMHTAKMYSLTKSVCQMHQMLISQGTHGMLNMEQFSRICLSQLEYSIVSWHQWILAQSLCHCLIFPILFHGQYKYCMHILKSRPCPILQY